MSRNKQQKKNTSPVEDVLPTAEGDIDQPVVDTAPVTNNDSVQPVSNKNSIDNKVPATKGNKVQPTALKLTLREHLAENAKGDMTPMCTVITHYLDRAGPGATEKAIANANYALYSSLLNVINEPNNSKFRSNFDFINKLFVKYGDVELSPIRLSRCDYQWSKGAKHRDNYNLLIEVINTLANPKTRPLNKKKLNVEAILKFLDASGMRNITSYYNL